MIADELRTMAEYLEPFVTPGTVEDVLAIADRVEAVERDAARYRRMRGSAAFQDRNGPGLYWYLPRWNRDLPIGERLDAAIDAAIKEQADAKR